MAKRKKLEPLQATKTPEATLTSAITTEYLDAADISRVVSHTPPIPESPAISLQPIEQTNERYQVQATGDASPAAVSVEDLPASTARARARAEAAEVSSPVFRRFNREGRWELIEPTKNRMLLEAEAAGLDSSAARKWAWTELDRLYPPLPPETAPAAPEQPQTAAEPEVAGLYIVPEGWPPLVNNASLQAELGWVQAERLRVVSQQGNTTRVRLELASTPAPSMAALSWLETSIRSYAKYVDIVAKSMGTQQDEAEHVRRERMRQDEIRGLLQEMCPGERCPSCGRVHDVDAKG